jgi:hypothetical protein
MARLDEHYADHGEHLAAVLARQTPDELRVIAQFLRSLADTPDGYVTPAPTPGDSSDSSRWAGEGRLTSDNCSNRHVRDRAR